jgi:hypothetical protein
LARRVDPERSGSPSNAGTPPARRACAAPRWGTAGGKAASGSAVARMRRAAAAGSISGCSRTSESSAELIPQRGLGRVVGSLDDLVNARFSGLDGVFTSGAPLGGGIVPAASRSLGAGARPGHRVVSAACGLTRGASTKRLLPGSAPGPPSRTRRASGEHPRASSAPPYSITRVSASIRFTGAMVLPSATEEP